MIRKATDKVKERFVSIGGTISGATSILGSWQVCHNLCLTTITLLGIIGITVVGMPLIFLTKFALPFWIMAGSLFVVTLFFYFKKRCISERLILFNSGLVIAGIPFQSLQAFSPLFWIIGGVLIVFSISLFIKDKIEWRKHEKVK